MLPLRFASLFVAAFLSFANTARSQSAEPASEPIRVTVSLNADGSRTVYEFDSLNHKATATTTAKGGKPAGKIRYVLDDAGRFASGEVYGPDEKLRFKTLYKYDTAGRLTQEIQLGPEDAVRHKIVYAYDNNGKQSGYAVYDAAGKLIRQTGSAAPASSPAAKSRR